MNQPGAANMVAAEITRLGIATALMFSVQVALRGIPNVELISLLVILFTLRFGRKALYPIYAFVLLQGMLYGFHLWWIAYLYVWTLLWGVTTCFQKHKDAFFWAIVSGFFGLSFGILCALPYFFFGGGRVVVGMMVSGLWFDLAHGVGNFFLALVLFSPLYRRFVAPYQLSHQTSQQEGEC